MDTKDIVTSYFRAVESHDFDQVARWLHPEMVLIEHPNRVSPKGNRYEQDGMRAASERGAALLAKESYDIRSMIIEGERAAVLSEWSGTLAIDAGPMPAGHVLRAQICSIFELRDGKIWRQEQYDCFMP
ncbi:nuclear transport factor 2 family protein [Haliangium ochraceum]|uniref:SnoaL-like domain-containing protein n=1 Tax=Haliangium ochraceum (strain DSM 14365 / JCM 11303 / SMP-2) TaxID=502025 RepID=D0LWT7_HALO1|nr:nuclear transport factor 2 family protein [Haliangium ochraceum]ACY14184.1 hypothetical protein Hoch_1634 [Haliangium ochraceum DSM 14365]